MYNACRHVMSSGNRCKSPALHTGDFCFFHDRFHADARNAKFDTLRLPVPEDLASAPDQRNKRRIQNWIDLWKHEEHEPRIPAKSAI